MARLGTTRQLVVGGSTFTIAAFDRMVDLGLGTVEHLPVTIRILLEAALRRAESGRATDVNVRRIVAWPEGVGDSVAFRPSRLLLQDFTGTPALVDLAAMRSSVERAGGDVAAVNPVVPVDLVIDHSLQVDLAGVRGAYAHNLRLEYDRNRERYIFLKWAANAFEGLRLVPPGAGIMHQVNLEYLATVVSGVVVDGEMWAYPDSVLGTDSHTPMVSGMGVLGWGVGAVESVAVMLGEPVDMPLPEVVGVRLTGQLNPGVTATDAALTITRRVRSAGVVGAFVEFFGPGVRSLSLADRATISNMAPEYGATTGFFPVDEVTMRYLALTGRSQEHIALVDAYTKTQGLYDAAYDDNITYSRVVDVPLHSIEAVVAGPHLPNQTIALSDVGRTFDEWLTTQAHPVVESASPIRNGDVAIAAITSCTNTSNPEVMIAAGLLAKRAVEAGMTVPSHVKTSLAPGSPVVADYLRASGLLPYLEQLGFGIIGFGCTTCAGGSGPLHSEVASAVKDNGLSVAAVLSGNRNFEGRIHSQCAVAFLASPPLVVAYGLAGTVRIDVTSEAIGQSGSGQPVTLADLWPSDPEIAAAVDAALDTSMYMARYASIFDGGTDWQDLPIPTGATYLWDPRSTYIREPTLAIAVSRDRWNIEGARCLLLLGDSVTTDHISPAGVIPADGPAGIYLDAIGVPQEEFNVFGARRANYDVMTRGTFGNPQLANALVAPRKGWWTTHYPEGDIDSIFETAERYRGEGVELIILAGSEYGIGSSRDWAARGTGALGVRAVIAKSFERIHRSNLVHMGVLPLEFLPGEGAAELGLKGDEKFTIRTIGVDKGQPRSLVDVQALRPDGSTVTFHCRVTLTCSREVEYYLRGGILPMILSHLPGPLVVSGGVCGAD